MLARCIFVSIACLLGSCSTAAPQPLSRMSQTPESQLVPHLPRSDQGLSDDWFLGRWRVGASDCTLRLEAGADGAAGPVLASDCNAPWSGASRWRRPGRDRALLDLVDANGDTLWSARAIQPSAIAGVSGEGELVRLYWAQEGSHGGWVQPGGNPQ